MTSADHGFVLTVLPDDTQSLVRRGETIFQALRRYGYALRAGCREGGCGVCVLELMSGDTVDLLPVADSVLSAAGRDGGLCLPCRAVPTTDVVIRRDVSNLLRRTPYSDRLAVKDLAARVED